MANILIVDDVPTNIKILRASLSKKHSVVAAISGQKAISILDSQPIDLILLDVLMPDLDGFETAEIIKSDAKIQHIPIIFITGGTDEADREKGLLLGQDYIIKPFTSEELNESVQKALSTKRFMPHLDKLWKKASYLDLDDMVPVSLCAIETSGVKQDLNEISKLIKECVQREQDSVYYDKRFYVLLLSANNGSIICCYKIREMIEKTFRDLSVYIGIATSYPVNVKPSDLIEAAHKNLLESKHCNKIVSTTLTGDSCD